MCYPYRGRIIFGKVTGGVGPPRASTTGYRSQQAFGLLKSGEDVPPYVFAALRMPPLIGNLVVMRTLAEIKAAIPHLTVEELDELASVLQEARRQAFPSLSHSVLDIPTASVGAILPGGANDDLQGEMLEGRV